MTARVVTISLLMLMLAICSASGAVGSKLSPKKEEQLKNDLSKIWPYIQTVKVEYELVEAQLETIECDSAKKEYLLKYEHYVKDAYFDKVIKLNIRQGKLLLLLIDRELGKTPYDLLEKFLNKERANFWQKCAKLVDADLKRKYYSILYPEVEFYLEKLSRERKHDYLLPK
ncbi:MAG TPA: DUF4294 domain-containing protein [Prolixibacteraceae bacterium]|nr:DUF4294 domain-containing protein [Prolixibacteraceae bacterium]